MLILTWEGILLISVWFSQLECSVFIVEMYNILTFNLFVL